MTRQNLTEKEAKALDLTRQLWNAILEIEAEHVLNSDDIHQHRRDMYNIQNRILARNSIVEIERNFNK